MRFVARREWILGSARVSLPRTSRNANGHLGAMITPQKFVLAGRQNQHAGRVRHPVIFALARSG
jgi:hypothetical protein